MFITNICTKYKHFECFDIRNDLFEMQEYFKDSKYPDWLWKKVEKPKIEKHLTKTQR